MGRWHGLKKEERVYKECDNGEVEDVCHWLLQCSAWNSLRQPLLEAMDNVEEHFSTKDRDRTALFYHMHVETITFCRSLTLCGQLGSSNQSALFILSYTNDLSLALSLLTLVSLRLSQLYLFM